MGLDGPITGGGGGEGGGVIRKRISGSFSEN